MLSLFGHTVIKNELFKAITNTHIHRCRCIQVCKCICVHVAGDRNFTHPSNGFFNRAFVIVIWHVSEQLYPSRTLKLLDFKEIILAKDVLVCGTYLNLRASHT